MDKQDSRFGTYNNLEIVVVGIFTWDIPIQACHSNDFVNFAPTLVPLQLKTSSVLLHQD